MVAKCLNDSADDFEAWNALFEALAAMVVASALTQLGGEIGEVLL